MRRLLALGVAAGLAVIVALPGAAEATGSPSPSVSPTTTSSPSATPTPTGTPTTTPTPTPTKTKAPSKKPKPHKHPVTPPGGITVTGPHMYIPGTGNAHYAAASTVTVSRTRNLVNQMLQVSWTGFSPSSQPAYDNQQTAYPVMVAECKGTHPATPADCYNADTGGIAPTFNAYGPSNTAYATTDPNGTGKTDILLYTSVQNQFLQCDPTHPCSLIVIPAQGGDSLTVHPPHCYDHSQDPTGVGSGLAAGQYSFLPLTSATGTPNGYCSWQRRIVIPLSFAPVPSGCPLRATDFSAGGSPMLAFAMQQWQTGLCFNTNPVELSYNGSLNESEARNYFQQGILDVAFTNRPLTGPTKHPFTYAPVAVSATSVVYWVDNANNGLPYTNIKLNARLLTKMLTTSYSYTNDSCPGGGSAGFGCDNAVDNNPTSLFTDPEFHKVNPGTWSIAGTEFEIPTVVAGNSDMTWTTTNWLAADKDASNFLAGQFDPWGMHVDTYYLGLKYPVDGILPSDPYLPVSSQYVPIVPLSNVVLDQSLNQPSGNQDTRDSITQTFDALPPQVIGQRDLWAIVDQSDANRFLFPTAALQNAAGKFVLPTDQAMAAAVKDMTVNPDGITRSINETKKDPAAYPLTMVIYAVVPTGGISTTKAAKIAQFLDDVANQGQQSGTQPGELASGYLPLPESLRQQTLKAASEVLNQMGNPKKKPTTSPSKSPSPSASRSPSKSPSPSPSASTPGGATARSIAISFSRPDATGMSWVVLVLLIAGAVLMISGPAALLAGSPGARAALADGIRRIRRLGNRTRGPFGRGRPGGNRPGGSRHKRGMSRPTWRRNS